MAAETLDAAVANNHSLSSEKPSQTDGLLLEGAHGWTPTMYIKLVQDLGVDTVVAEVSIHYIEIIIIQLVTYKNSVVYLAFVGDVRR